MKVFIILFYLFSVCVNLEAAAPVSFSSLSKDIQIEQQGNWTYIHFQTYDNFSGFRIVRADVISPSTYGQNGKQNQVTLNYFFIRNMLKMTRSGEKVTITWKLRKSDWEAWSKNMQVNILKQDDINLYPDDINTIKTKW